MELTLSQLHDLEIGDKVWVNVVVDGDDKGTYEVEVLEVDVLDYRDPVAVMLPSELAVDLGIKDIIEERMTSFTGVSGYRYWVENLLDYGDEHHVRIAAVAAPDKITDKAPVKRKQAETGNPKNELEIVVGDFIFTMEDVHEFLKTEHNLPRNVDCFWASDLYEFKGNSFVLDASKVTQDVGYGTADTLENCEEDRWKFYFPIDLRYNGEFKLVKSFEEFLKNKTTAKLNNSNESQMVVYNGKLFQKLKMADNKSSEAVIQDLETKEVRIIQLDSSVLFTLEPELIKAIKKFA